MTSFQNYWWKMNSKTTTLYFVINRISSHLCNKVSMYCSFHKMKWWSLDVVILLRTLRNYQEWNSIKRLIWKISENDQHLDQHQQLSVKTTDETIWTLVRTVINSIMNQLILQWLYKFKHDQQIKVNSTKTEECVKSKETLSKKKKSINTQRNTKML